MANSTNTINQTEFEKTVETLRFEINEKLLVNSNGDSGLKHEWLRTLYNNYTARFLSDNNRIWITGGIMIPISLAAFAVVPKIENPKFSDFVILGIASSAVMIVWVIIAENHRAFQEKSRAWIVAIERELGLVNTGKPKIRDSGLSRWLTGSAVVQRMRWLLTIGVIIGWVLIIAYFWPYEDSTSKKQPMEFIIQQKSSGASPIDKDSIPKQLMENSQQETQK